MCQWMKATNGLSSRIVLEKSYLSRDVNFGLFFGGSEVLVRSGFGTVATAVVEDIQNTTKECRVSVEVSLAILGTVPLCLMLVGLLLGKVP